MFGGWTSASRKAMLPVFEGNKALLFYPVQYEGLESSPNIFYTGATTNQQIVPASTTSRSRARRRSSWSAPTTSSRAPPTRSSRPTPRRTAWRSSARSTPRSATPSTRTIVNKIDAGQARRRLQHAQRRQQRRLLQAAQGAGRHRRADAGRSRCSVAEEEVGGIGVGQHRRPPGGLELLPDHRHAGEQGVRRGLQGQVRRGPGHRRPDRGRLHAVYLWAAAAEKAGIDRGRGGQEGGRRASSSTRPRAWSPSTARTSTSPRRPASACPAGRPDRRGLELRRADQARPVPQGLRLGQRAWPRAVTRRQPGSTVETFLNQLFIGLSIGAVLLLVALGLTFTFGQMGVINMAHGEFIMAGAYTAYVLQALVGTSRPCWSRCRWRSWSAGLLGLILERLAHPALLRPAARHAAGDLGRQPDPAAGRPRPLRRAERAGHGAAAG